MTSYIDTRTLEYPLSEQNVMDRANQIGAFSLPESYAEVTVLPKPEVGYEFDVLVAPPSQTDSGWVQDWVVNSASPDDVASRLDRQWALVRKQRAPKLTSCDWTQLADSPLNDTDKAAWATYRQALRDITTQPDPFSIVWPDAP